MCNTRHSSSRAVAAEPPQEKTVPRAKASTVPESLAGSSAALPAANRASAKTASTPAAQPAERAVISQVVPAMQAELTADLKTSLPLYLKEWAEKTDKLDKNPRKAFDNVCLVELRARVASECRIRLDDLAKDASGTIKSTMVRMVAQGIEKHLDRAAIKLLISEGHMPKVLSGYPWKK